MTNYILLAFDGLSKQDVDNQYVLNEFQLDNYDEINLGKRPFYFTSELFTDLITGYNHKQHGVRGLNKITEGRFGINPTGFERWLQRNFFPLFYSYKGFRNGLYKTFLGGERIKWERSDIRAQTVFDEYDNAYQCQVPVYDWRKADVFHHLVKEDRPVSKSVEHIEDEFHRSKRKFWENFDSIDWGKHENVFYMHHFHYIDWLQHLYREDSDFESVMQKPWNEAAAFVREVKQKLPEDYELVLMSDHGLPERGIGHRPNAFLSYNQSDLFSVNPTLQEMNYWIRQMCIGAGDEDSETSSESDAGEISGLGGVDI